MSAHLYKDATWHACRPRKGECRLPVHVDMTVAEARDLPYAMLRPLLDTLLPPDDTEADGTLVWRDGNGRIHRDYDLPAVVVPGESEEWHRHGYKHREGDKPAIIFANGEAHWFIDGMRHRDGGKPAVIHRNGKNFWYHHGVFMNEEDA